MHGNETDLRRWHCREVPQELEVSLESQDWVLEESSRQRGEAKCCRTYDQGANEYGTVDSKMGYVVKVHRV